MKINLNDIETEQMLQLIRCYFSAEILRKLELNSTFSLIYHASLERFALTLQNLQTLTLTGAGNSYLNLSNHSVFFVKNVANLKALHLKYVKMSFRKIKSTYNLSELTIEDCKGLDNQFERFLIRNPNLKTFGFKSTSRKGRSQFHPALLETIIRILPNLEALFFEIETHSNDDFPYDLLLSLKQLKRLKITSYKEDCVDIYEFLKKFAVQNTVEELTIAIKARKSNNGATKRWANDFPVFSSLQSLEIINPVRKTEIFLIRFVRNSTNLTKCIFRSTSPILQTLLYSVAVHVRELRLLLLHSPRTGIHKLYRNLYKKFLHSRAFPCELCVNQAQFTQYFNSKSRKLYDLKVLKITSHSSDN